MSKLNRSVIAIFLFVIVSLMVASAAYAVEGHSRTSREWWRSRYSQGG